jgi:hypothetical protein
MWTVNMTSFADGESINVGDVHNPSVTVTAPTTNVLAKTTLATFWATAGELIFLRVKRDAVNAADTLANDAALLAVRVDRAR